ncbi:g10633 [Coccomyxa elongata]
MAMEMEGFDVCNWILPTSGVDAAYATSYPLYSPVLNDHLLDMHLNPENEMEGLIMQELSIVGDIQHQWPTLGLQTSNAMDIDSILHNCYPQTAPIQYTLASPDLSTGTCAQVWPAFLPATSPLQYSPPLQLEVTPTNNATVLEKPTPAPRLRKLPKSMQKPVPKPPPLIAPVHAPAFQPRTAQRPRARQPQQVLLAPAHARPAEARGLPEARGRASAERSARSSSRGRSRSHSPIRNADVAISDVSGDEGGLSASDSDDEEPVDKKPGKTSKYTGVSYHKGNRKWRTTVYYEDAPRHMGYHIVEEDAARRYDELAVFIWPDRETNFPKDQYPSKDALEAEWLPKLKAKVAAQEERRKKKAEKAARREEAKAKLKAAGGTRKLSAKKTQDKRKQKALGSSDSGITISDASLKNLLDDDDEGEFCWSRSSSRRPEASVATRARRPMRKAAQVAQEKCKAWAENHCEFEEDPDELHEAQLVPAAACHHARATAAAEQRLRALQARAITSHRTRCMEFSPAWCYSLQRVLCHWLHLGSRMELMDEDAIEDHLLEDLASNPLA